MASTIACGADNCRLRTRRNKLRQPWMSVRPTQNRSVVPFCSQRCDGSTEIVINVPEGSVGPKQPRCSDCAHESDSPMTGCLAVDMESLRAGRFHHVAYPLRDVLGKVHVMRPNG